MLDMSEGTVELRKAAVVVSERVLVIEVILHRLEAKNIIGRLLVEL